MIDWITRDNAPKGLHKYKPWVLGIQWGQFPAKVEEGKPGEQAVVPEYGSGMTTVVPAWKIKQFILEDPRLKLIQEQQREMMKNTTVADEVAVTTK